MSSVASAASPAADEVPAPRKRSGGANQPMGVGGEQLPPSSVSGSANPDATPSEAIHRATSGEAGEGRREPVAVVQFSPCRCPEAGDLIFFGEGVRTISPGIAGFAPVRHSRTSSRGAGRLPTETASPRMSVFFAVKRATVSPAPVPAPPVRCQRSRRLYHQSAAVSSRRADKPCRRYLDRWN